MPPSGTATPRAARILHCAVLGSLSVSVVLAVVAFAQGRASSLLAIASILLWAGAFWGSKKWSGTGNAASKALLSLALLNLITLVPELALRVSGFHHESRINFGFPRPEHFQRLVRDESLLWKLDNSRPGVNSIGFPGDELEFDKREGVFRILYLGDSCTYEGAPVEPYTRIVQRLLDASPGDGQESEYVALALPGYTSFQGRALATMYGARLQPDLVVVYYGWNDHWLAYGAIDSEKKFDTSLSARILEAVRAKSRLLQFLSLTRKRISGARPALMRSLRVPLDEYRDNLEYIVRLFEECGTPVLLITAPTAHRLVGVPDYLLDMNFVVDKASAVEIHSAYTDVVRKVASAQGTHILDLENEFNDLTAETVGELLMTDGIHLTDSGVKRVAGRLHGFYSKEFGL